MAKVLFEGTCCECCLLVIANGDESGCRDYYGHTHTAPILNERLTRHLNEETGDTLTGEQWAAYAVPSADPEDEDGGREEITGCDLCDGVDGYAYGYPFAIIR